MNDYESEFSLGPTLVILDACIHRPYLLLLHLFLLPQAASSQFALIRVFQMRDS